MSPIGGAECCTLSAGLWRRLPDGVKLWILSHDDFRWQFIAAVDAPPRDKFWELCCKDGERRRQEHLEHEAHNGVRPEVQVT